MPPLFLRLLHSVTLSYLILHQKIFTLALGKKTLLVCRSLLDIFRNCTLFKAKSLVVFAMHVSGLPIALVSKIHLSTLTYLFITSVVSLRIKSILLESTSFSSVTICLYHPLPNSAMRHAAILRYIMSLMRTTFHTPLKLRNQQSFATKKQKKSSLSLYGIWLQITSMLFSLGRSLLLKSHSNVVHSLSATTLANSLELASALGLAKPVFLDGYATCIKDIVTRQTKRNMNSTYRRYLASLILSFGLEFPTSRICMSQLSRLRSFPALINTAQNSSHFRSTTID